MNEVGEIMKQKLFLMLMLLCLSFLGACDYFQKDSTSEVTDYSNEDFKLSLPSVEFERLWPEYTKLVWLVSDGMILDVDPDIFVEFNNKLIEKGADFVVQFIGIDPIDIPKYQEHLLLMYEDKIQIDLLNTGFGDENIETYPRAMKNGLLEELDPYLDTELGKELFNMLDQKAWDRIRIDGNIYGINNWIDLSQHLYLFVNSKVLEKFNFDLENTQSLSVLENKLAIWSESAHGNDIPLYIWLEDYRELLDYSFLNHGIAVKYDDTDTPHAFNYLKADEVIKSLQTLLYLKDNNYLYEDDDSFDKVINGDFLFFISYAFPEIYYDGKLKIGPQEITVDAHKLKEGSIVMLSSAVDGIASWSNYKKEAFELLVMINTDPDLSNLLRFGIEGKQYNMIDGELVENKEIQRAPGFYTPANQLITHPIGLEPQNKADIYRELTEEFQMSPIAGFTLDESNIAEELIAIQEIYTAYDGLWRLELEDVEATLALAKQELQEAQIELVLEEINRQLAAWWQEKEE